jgi:hypothetical protein
MQTSPSLAQACEEKARLIGQRAVAEANHHRVIQELTWRVGTLPKPDFKALQEFAKSARSLVDDAREALERHTSEHGC